MAQPLVDWTDVCEPQSTVLRKGHDPQVELQPAKEVVGRRLRQAGPTVVIMARDAPQGVP